MFLEFLKLVETLETKDFKLLKNVKTWWISTLSPLKHGIAKYKGSIVKMHYDCVKTKFDHENLKLLCDLELILALPYFTPMLEVA
jgi:hypothetical protein